MEAQAEVAFSGPSPSSVGSLTSATFRRHSVADRGDELAPDNEAAFGQAVESLAKALTPSPPSTSSFRTEVGGLIGEARKKKYEGDATRFVFRYIAQALSHNTWPTISDKIPSLEASLFLLPWITDKSSSKIARTEFYRRLAQLNSANDRIKFRRQKVSDFAERTLTNLQATAFFTHPGVIKQLAEFEHLTPNWDSNGALPVARSHSTRAQGFLAQVMGYTSIEPEVVPLADGGVQLEWRLDRGVRIDFITDDEDSEGVVLFEVAGKVSTRPAERAVAEVRNRLEQASARGQ